MATTAEHTPDTGRSDDTAGVVCHLDITGMTCASCVRRIEKGLTEVDGIASVPVNPATEVATVTYFYLQRPTSDPTTTKATIR